MLNLERIGNVVNDIITKQRQPLPAPQPTNETNLGTPLFFLFLGFLITKIFKF